MQFLTLHTSRSRCPVFRNCSPLMWLHQAGLMSFSDLASFHPRTDHVDLPAGLTTLLPSVLLLNSIQTLLTQEERCGGIRSEPDLEEGVSPLLLRK